MSNATGVQPDTDQVQDRPFLRDRLGFAPGQVIRVSGMRRSGNHAILSWLQRNAPPPGAVFLNNCKPASNPLDSFSTIEINDHKTYAKRGQNRLTKAIAASDPPVTDGALLLFSYEDTSPHEFTRKRNLSGDFDQSLITTELHIYRGFLNWAASLLKKMQPNDGFSLARRTSIILRAIDTYARLLDLISRSQDRANVVPICYDQWVTSQNHRSDLLTRLNLSERDNALGPVQSYGGGSSFQKDAETAQDLQTGHRWQVMADDLEFQAILLLAAQDNALMHQLNLFFPQDAARLAALSHSISLPQGDVS